MDVLILFVVLPSMCCFGASMQSYRYVLVPFNLFLLLGVGRLRLLVPWQRQRKLPSFLNRYSGTLQPYLSSSFERFCVSSITS